MKEDKSSGKPKSRTSKSKAYALYDRPKLDRPNRPKLTGLHDRPKPNRTDRPGTKPATNRPKPNRPPGKPGNKRSDRPQANTPIDRSKTEGTSGILKKGRGGLVLVNLVQPSTRDVFVPRELIREYALVEGASVSGQAAQGPQGPVLVQVDSICGVPPEAYKTRGHFAELTAIDPNERFHLGASGEMAMRAVDLIAPIGRGTRGLIVAPPKAGKTTLLEQIAQGIRRDKPSARIVVLLIDERPEEMTYFRRNVQAEVFASSSDQSAAEHSALTELMLAHIRAELECGNDVVVLLDSLTRMARTFNLRATGPGRTLSGGIDASALDIPRRFFGLARNIEKGGSVTIIATLLIDTGSRMDQFLYQEFKGTGNSEIVLDRELAQAHLFPAIDIGKSGTRKEELLYSVEEMSHLRSLRRGLADMRPREALTRLLELIDKYPTNAELISSLPASRF